MLLDMLPSQMHLQDSNKTYAIRPQGCNQETAATPAMDIWISDGFHMDFIWILTMKNREKSELKLQMVDEP